MRFLKWLLVALVVLALVVGVYGFWTVRRSFPTVQGDLQVDGLDAPVDVIRDDWGIPHIYASTPHDLFFAQGYTHAQERFWQMDFWRHIGAARLSEMFGEGQVETDEFLRSLGFVELAERELEMMPDEAREVLEWYTEGVNAYLADHDGARVSLEYAVLPLQNSGYEIEPWTPVNILTWAKMMAWDLGGNMGSEINRAILSADLPVERVEELYPPYPDRHPVIVPADQVSVAVRTAGAVPNEALAALNAAGVAADRVWSMTGGGFEGIGSNNWILGGSLTESGKPILANDPHLAIQMPSIWFANGLHCVETSVECPYQLVGFSFAGTPGVVLGHNDRIAWGVTNESAADTQDLFIERINPDNPDQYEVDGEWVDFEIRNEVIEVAGGEDVEVEVKISRHGPVISGTYLEDDELDEANAIDLPEEYVVALAWQALQPSTLVEAILELNRAGDYDEFREAVSKWDIAPQNIVYADVDGNIAYQSTGEIPIRADGDGRYPVPGWTSQYEWIGLVPFEDLPRLLNPPRDYIASANQQVVRPGSDPYFGADASYGYRANRIEEMIKKERIHTVASVQQMQMDSRDGGADAVVPALLAVPDADDQRVRTIQSWLRAWQGGSEEYQSTAQSTSAAVYQATWRHLLANTFHDDLPEDRLPAGGSLWFEVVRNLIQDPDSMWWDNTATDGRETLEDILFVSMTDAHDELVELLGDDPNGWEWGKLHIAHFENQTFGQSGIGPVEWLFNRTAPDKVGGGASLVNAVGWSADESYQVDWVPSMRMVVDLDDFSNSSYIHTTGNSGHAFHRFYDNMIEAWTEGVQAPMYWGLEETALGATATLRLIPSND